MHWLPLVCGMTENRDEHKLFADLDALTEDQKYRSALRLAFGVTRSVRGCSTIYTT